MKRYTTKANDPIRTTLYLDKPFHDLLKKKARKEHLTMGEYIRVKLTPIINEKGSKANPISDGDVLPLRLTLPSHQEYYQDEWGNTRIRDKE